jgi:hypothetical protein
MKTWILFLSLILSLPVLAVDIVDGLKIEGSDNVLAALTAAHSEFENPYCLAKGIRTADDQDLFVITGHVLSSLSFERRVITVGEEQPRELQVMHVVANYLDVKKQKSLVSTEFNCLLPEPPTP